MPAAPAVPPPVAPSPSIGAVTPPQPKEIHVNAPTTPAAPPKPGSPKSEMFGRMRTKLGVEPDAPATTSTPDKPAAPTPDKKEAPKSEQGTAETPAPVEESTLPAVTEEKPKTPLTAEQKKVSPWKLVDQFKDKALKAEQRALELEKLVIPEEQRTQLTERLTKAEQRAKELEDEIRYANYQKSDEFKQKYLQPYETRWKQAMGELQGMTFKDANDQSQTFSVDHMMQLVHMPLQQARATANSLFGDLANDVMNHRNGIKEMLDQQGAALEEAKKTGSERENQKRQQWQAFMNETSSKAKEWWEQSNKEIVGHPEHGEFLKPKEGNEEWNSLVEKGFDFAKKAFSAQINNPQLTPEQRHEAVKMQSALYNKAAAYGPMRYEIKNLRKQIAERDAELKTYKDTTPASGGPAPNTAQAAPSTNGFEGLHQRLRARVG